MLTRIPSFFSPLKRVAEAASTYCYGLQRIFNRFLTDTPPQTRTTTFTQPTNVEITVMSESDREHYMRLASDEVGLKKNGLPPELEKELNTLREQQSQRL